MTEIDPNKCLLFTQSLHSKTIIILYYAIYYLYYLLITLLIIYYIISNAIVAYLKRNAENVKTSPRKLRKHKGLVLTFLSTLT